MNPLNLMRLYVATANRVDDEGLLLETNDGLGSYSPRLFFGSTPAGVCWYFRHDLNADVVSTIEAHLFEQPQRYADDAEVQFAHYDEILNALAPQNSETRMECGPFYWFREPVSPAGDAEQLDVEDAERLIGGMEAWRDAVPFYRPFIVSCEGEDVAAICSSVRRRSSAHIAGCETEPRFRRRGHAAKAVAAWAKAVQELNAIAFYNTTWANVASQRTAAATGAVQFGVGLAIY